ncbi:MAG: response regulator [Mediterraneibacter gnavus]
MNVLIVDDDKLARKGLIAIMDWEKYGFKVAGDVQNGRKALEFLRTHPVDIVFTDIDMPEIDGLELMQMCKEEFPDIKFVIFLCMKISVMHRLRFVWGRWTISRRSVFPWKSVNRYWSGSAQSTGRQAETGRQTGKTGKNSGN